MKKLSRIEKSAFKRGSYVGHCHGAQLIVRAGTGWATIGKVSPAGVAVYASAPTLVELNDKLEALERKLAPCK